MTLRLKDSRTLTLHWLLSSFQARPRALAMVAAVR